jgi:hypothetical protein
MGGHIIRDIWTESDQDGTVRFATIQTVSFTCKFDLITSSKLLKFHCCSMVIRLTHWLKEQNIMAHSSRDIIRHLFKTLY